LWPGQRLWPADNLGSSVKSFANIGAAVVSDPNDGERKRSFSELSSADSRDNLKLTLLAEELTVDKQAIETGRVRVSKQTHTREVDIDEDLLKESAEIETTLIGRQIFEMPVIRHEGETTIIPIVEEVLHTERRLFLKEEVRITRKKTTEQFHDHVTLRHQEAVVTRVQSTSEAVDNPSINKRT
jgi:uncharacterized protein (TIGR02271 family)